MQTLRAAAQISKTTPHVSALPATKFAAAALRNGADIIDLGPKSPGGIVSGHFPSTCISAPNLEPFAQHVDTPYAALHV